MNVTCSLGVQTNLICEWPMTKAIRLVKGQTWVDLCALEFMPIFKYQSTLVASEKKKTYKMPKNVNNFHKEKKIVKENEFLWKYFELFFFLNRFF
jgi:hypothetical protein